eukprot:scaffold88162_cov34-Prasinocladus_malaysianus.AAC.2
MAAAAQHSQAALAPEQQQAPQTLTTPVAFNLDTQPPVVAPEFQVYEKADGFDVKANMQGGDNVRLGVTTDRVIHIVAEKTGGNLQHSHQQLVQRAVPLPENVDETKVTAAFKDGELSMKIPKKVPSPM